MLTVKELKDFIKDLPETNSDGEPLEVWIRVEKYFNSPCNKIVQVSNGNLVLAL